MNRYRDPASAPVPALARPARAILLVIAALLLTAGAPLAALAQGAPTVVAQRLDVAMEIQPNGDVLVRETWQYSFNPTSPIRRGFRTLSLEHVAGYGDVAVSEDGTAYAQLQPGQPTRPQTFRAGTNDQGEFQIEWFFSDIARGAQRSWTIAYRARGAILQYPGGDQLWRTVVRDLGYPIQAATVTVTLPADAPADAVRFAAYPEGVATSVAQTGPRTVSFSLRPIPAGGEAEVRVQFPHGAISAPPPAWQAEFDRSVWLREQVRPVAEGALSLLALMLMPILGLVVLLYLYWTRGRDPAVGEVPEVLSEPPSRLPPGMVGTLIDERADPHDVLATLADLGQRGILRIREVRDSSLVGSNHDFELERLPLPPGERLRPYEQTLLDAIFAGTPADGAEEGTGAVRLSRIRGRLFPAIPQFALQLERAVAEAGLTNGVASDVRRHWRGVGVGLLVLSIIGAVVAAILFGWLTGAVVLPFITLGLFGVALMWLAPKLVSRTAAGALEARRWLAFRRYLERLPRAEPGPAPERDEVRQRMARTAAQYLPYAIAFGLNKSWVQRLTSIGVPAPPWFRPYAGPLGGPYMPGPYGPYGPPYPPQPYGPPVIVIPGPGGWGGPHHPGGWRGPGEQPSGQPSGGPTWAPPAFPTNPDEASREAGQSFDDASEALVRMFDTASTLFSGRGDGGGDGWSGGGHGGGGGWSGGGRGGGFGGFVGGAAAGGGWFGRGDGGGGGGGGGFDSGGGGGFDSGGSSSGE